MDQEYRDDMKTLFRKLDTHSTQLTDLKVDVAVVKQKVEDFPSIPTRPCDELTRHVTSHAENAKMVKKPLVSAAIDLVKMAIVGAVCFLIGKK